jgi:hypothetical protein
MYLTLRLKCKRPSIVIVDQDPAVALLIPHYDPSRLKDISDDRAHDHEAFPLFLRRRDDFISLNRRRFSSYVSRFSIRQGGRKPCLYQVTNDFSEGRFHHWRELLANSRRETSKLQVRCNKTDEISGRSLHLRDNLFLDCRGVFQLMGSLQNLVDTELALSSAGHRLREERVAKEPLHAALDAARPMGIH